MKKRKEKKSLSLVVGMPTYNGEVWIKETMESILSQSFQDFRMVVSDDCSEDQTVKIIKSYKDKRIKIYQNRKNLGYGKNLQVLKRKVKGDILFLMAQDDILLKDGLLKTYQAFLKSDEIGAVTRPYYWFYEKVKKPVRVVDPYDEEKDSIISIFDGQRAVQKIFGSVGQLSGLAYRTKYMNVDFHPETFVSHVYPFASVAKKHKAVFLKSYTVAVRIPSSQTRFKPSIYNISPTASWVKMFKTVYKEAQYKKVRKTGIDQMTTHFVGLAQIKNFGKFKNLIKEIFTLGKLRPLNLINPKFWLFSLGAVLIPKVILRWLTDNYKNRVLAQKYKNIQIKV